MHEKIPLLSRPVFESSCRTWFPHVVPEGTSYQLSPDVDIQPYLPENGSLTVAFALCSFLLISCVSG